jgi:hypothetical protein
MTSRHCEAGPDELLAAQKSSSCGASAEVLPALASWAKQGSVAAASTGKLHDAAPSRHGVTSSLNCQY